jgi:hypothetical protein
MNEHYVEISTSTFESINTQCREFTRCGRTTRVKESSDGRVV